MVGDKPLQGHTTRNYFFKLGSTSKSVHHVLLAHQVVKLIDQSSPKVRTLVVQSPRSDGSETLNNAAMGITLSTHELLGNISQANQNKQINILYDEA